ncbi:MAG: YdcF family protein [Fidelibacterota bacterium]
MRDITAYQTLFDYLYPKEDPEKSDIIIGFGSFDLKVPDRCAELYVQGFADKILFTGGIGAGTADLGKPEAQAFLDYIHDHFPQIHDDDIFIEDQSTNTGENLEFSQRKLLQQEPPFDLSKEGLTAILVTTAARQKRAELTWRKQFPKTSYVNCPPETTFEQETELFLSKRLDLRHLVLKEIYKIASYPKLGYIAEEKIPGPVKKALKSINRG